MPSERLSRAPRWPSTRSISPTRKPRGRRGIRAEWREHGKSKTKGGKWVKGVRWSLLKAPERQSISQLASLGEVSLRNRRLFRAFLLKEELRLLYHLDDPALAPEHLAAWLAWASRSKLRPFVRLARTIRRHRTGILAAIRLGLSNAKLEGLNSKVRLISHRSFGFHGAAPLIALVYLCCGGVTVDRRWGEGPTQTTEAPNKSGGGGQTISASLVCRKAWLVETINRSRPSCSKSKSDCEQT